MNEKNMLENFKTTFNLLKTAKFFLIFIISLVFNFFLAFYFAINFIDYLLDQILILFSFELQQGSFIYYLYQITRFILSWLLFSFLIIPISNIFCGLVGDYVFDLLPNRSSIKIPKEKNSFLKSIIFSFKAAAINLLINIAILPLYFFLPGINYVAFIAVNGYLLGRELSGCFVVQFKGINLNSFYNQQANVLFISGALFAILITIPLIRYLVPFFAILFYANLTLEYFKKDNLSYPS